MKTQYWRRILILAPFILLVTFSFTSWVAQASTFLGPTPPPLPIQGCNTATGIGSDFKTCAFYVTINEDDAGTKPECNNYAISWSEVYFGTCNSGTTSIVSGFRFQNVSLPPNLSLLASYMEFTIDGPYGANNITANIYRQASLAPNSFTGTSPADITGRPTVQPTATWNITSTNSIYNMGDPWALGETRRTPDTTSILTAIMNQNGWQSNNPVVFLFKNMTSAPTSSRRITAKERLGYSPARLVVRVGQIPRPSVSYYWQSVHGCSPKKGCTPDNNILAEKARKEAQRNQPVLVILDFGNPKVNSAQMGTTIINRPDKHVSIAKIEIAVKRYISVFMKNDLTNSKLWLGVGTNNAGDLMCANLGYGTSHGTQWAAMINRLNDWVTQQNYNTAANPDKIKISGASDIETWTGRPDSPSILKCGAQTIPIAPPSEALNWAQAYSAMTNYSYINFGNYSDDAQGLGLNQWGADLTWELSWGIPEAYPLPEIYTPTGTLSAKWQTLARYSAICTGSPRCQPEIRADDPNWRLIKGRTMQFLGSLTNYGEQNCSINANSPNQGWLQLYRHLVVDLYTDNDFPAYSSDITYEDSAHQTADTCPTP